MLTPRPTTSRPRSHQANSHFLEIFNYSVIPFSGQWRLTEPQQGKPNYADLDKYVDWCTTNSVRPEFRFLAGYQPTWVKNKVPRDQADFILARAKELSQRHMPEKSPTGRSPART